MPIILEHKPDPQTRIAVWEISETETVLYTTLPSLSKSDALFLQQLRNKTRRMEWMASRILLHQLTGLYPSVIYNSEGQPVLKNSDLKISISHTKGYAAIALSSNQPPGIDIEYPSTRIEKVAGRFMHPSEWDFVSANHKSTQQAIIWCAKEAIFKMAGQPGLNFKNDIVLNPFIPRKKGNLKATLQPGTRDLPIKLEFIITPRYYLVYSLNL